VEKGGAEVGERDWVEWTYGTNGGTANKEQTYSRVEEDHCKTEKTVWREIWSEVILFTF